MKLSQPAISSRLSSLQRWTQLSEPVDAIERRFKFKDFHHTMAFVNAVAWIAHSRGHHPDLQVGYDSCNVRYSTHSDGGLTDKDFSSASAVDALLG